MSLSLSRKTLWIVLTSFFYHFVSQVSCGREGPELLLGAKITRELQEVQAWTGAIVLPLELGNSNTPNLQLYYTTVQIGTPPQTLKVACDTGSSLLWVNCECASPLEGGEGGDDKASTTTSGRGETGCTDSAIPFDPSASSSVLRPLCSDPVCNVDQSAVTTCDLALTGQVCSTVQYAPSFCKGKVEDTCPYLLSYSDDSYSTGVILTDMVSVRGLLGDSVRVPFGCGQSQGGHLRNGAAFGEFSGLIGLGRGNSAVKLLAEAAAERDVFSLCLGGEGGGSVLVIGEVLRPPKGRISTPMLPPTATDEPSYAISLEAILVGREDVLQTPTNMTGGRQSSAVIDSGATYSVLPNPIFAAFTEALIRSMPPNLPRAYPTGLDLIGPALPPCWDPSGIDVATLTASIPPVSLVFGGGEKLEVLPRNLMRFVPVSKDGQKVAMCAAVIAGGPYNASSVVIGENWLRNVFLTFDRAGSTISWAHVDCLTGNATVDRNLQPISIRSPRGRRVGLTILGHIDPFLALGLLVLPGLVVFWVVYRTYSSGRRGVERLRSYTYEL